MGHAPLVVRITVDTNLINLRGGLEAMNTLERWAAEGKVTLVGTSRLLHETARDARPGALQKARSMPNIAEPFILDHSFFDVPEGGAYLAGDDGPQFSELASVMFPGIAADKLAPQQANDVIHLLAHIEARVDVFVSNDKKAFFNDHRRTVLKERFGVTVMSPEECVEHVRSTLGLV